MRYADANTCYVLDRIIARGEDLPPQAIADLKQLLTKLRSGNQEERQEFHDLAFNRTGSDSLQTSTSAKLLIALTVTMLVANLIAPDSVFAKSFTSYGSSGDDGLSWGLTEMMMTIAGVVCLSSLNSDSSSK